MQQKNDLKIKDIITISGFQKKKKFFFSSCLRPLDKNYLVNTIFKWDFGGSSIHLLGNWNSWKKKIPLKKSGNEFSVILPLKPGFFEYHFTIDGKRLISPSQNIKTISSKNINNFKNVKRLDKEIISSDSLLDGETKLYSYYQELPKIDLIESNNCPKLIPSQLIVSVYSKCSSSLKKYYSSDHTSFYNVSRMIFFNHLIFYRNFNLQIKYQNQVFFSKIRFKKKIGTIFYFLSKFDIYNNRFHPIKILF